MSTISLNNKVSTQSHVLVITEKFVNEFDLPEKVNDYIVNALKDKDKKTLTYNYIGKYISIIIIDKSKEETELNEQLRRHGAGVADAINAHKGKEIYIYNQTRKAELSLAAALSIYSTILFLTATTP